MDPYRTFILNRGRSINLLPNTYNIFGNSSKPSLKDLFVVFPASYFSSSLMAQLMAMGHPIPVICNKMQRIPEIGRPMVKNISQGLRTDKYERSFIAHYLLFQFTPLSRGLYSSRFLAADFQSLPVNLPASSLQPLQQY